MFMVGLLKLLLILPMAIIELLFLIVCWGVALIHKPTGAILTQWSIDNLPAKEWYLGRSKDTENQ